MPLNLMVLNMSYEILELGESSTTMLPFPSFQFCCLTLQCWWETIGRNLDSYLDAGIVQLLEQHLPVFRFFDQPGCIEILK